MRQEEAESIAISALAFIAGDDKLLPRFLALTGIEANEVRAAAAEPGFLAGVLQFLLAHEPTLMDFCAASKNAPQDIGAAAAALPLGDMRYDISS